MPLKLDAERPVGLVLSGGGARGAFQVGVWEVLRSDPRGFDHEPLVVSGTSAGAINGALIAAGLTPRDMLAFWLDLARNPPVIANYAMFRSIERAIARLALREPLRRPGRRARAARILGQLLAQHKPYRPSYLLAMLLQFALTARFDNVSDLLDMVTSSHLFDTSPLRDRFVRVFGGESITNPRVRLAINVVDVRTGKAIRLVNHPPTKHSESDDTIYHYHPAITADMVIASSSIPLLFNTVVVDGIELWDGGVLVNTPMAPAVALGARRIVPVLVTAGEDSTKHDPMPLGTGVERLADAFLTNAYNTDRKLLLTRNELARRLPELGLAEVELFQAIKPASSNVFNAGSYLYFEEDQLMRMYEAGRAAARRWLVQGPPRDLHPRG